MTAVSESPPASERPAAVPRFAFIDNARFWVMIMVVVAHPMFHFISLAPGRAVYFWLNLLMMPAFAMLSGYVSRNFTGTRKQIQRTVSTLVIPYLLIDPIYQIAKRHDTGSPDPYVLLSPKWVAWWLAALFIWRLSTPLWRHLRHPILVAVAISLVTPLFELPNVFAMEKVLGMLPFYVIGMFLTMDHFAKLAETPARITSAVFLIGVGAACALYSQQWDVTWTKWRDRYEQASLGSATMLEGMGIRSVLLVVGVLMAFAVVSLSSRKESWMTRFGQRTLYCYLLHGIVVKYLEWDTAVFPALRDLGSTGIAITIACAVVLALLLMTKPVAVAFRPLFESNLDWAFRTRDRLPG